MEYWVLKLKFKFSFHNLNIYLWSQNINCLDFFNNKWINLFSKYFCSIIYKDYSHINECYQLFFMKVRPIHILLWFYLIYFNKLLSNLYLLNVQIKKDAILGKFNKSNLDKIRLFSLKFPRCNRSPNHFYYLINYLNCFLIRSIILIGIWIF